MYVEAEVGEDPDKRDYIVSNKRLLGTGAGIIFKGGGFYETDYRSANYKAGEKKAKDAAKKATEKKSDSKKSESKKSGDSKPKKKT